MVNHVTFNHIYIQNIFHSHMATRSLMRMRYGRPTHGMLVSDNRAFIIPPGCAEERGIDVGVRQTELQSQAGNVHVLILNTRGHNRLDLYRGGATNSPRGHNRLDLYREGATNSPRGHDEITRDKTFAHID